ncbi:Variant-specific surface protein [Giardia duodenalis]|uniref:Variant-specific surface protein n=1 Tax=Giardia intestinalis TaxID=5741 RepID=V6TQ59_GIAIN|nr:Variant-specific surface protein [Giardia intestinalis]
MRGRVSRLVRQIVAVSSLQHTHQATRVHTLLAGRYCSVGVAGSSACREARDGACVMYREMGADEEHSVDDGRRGAHDSTEGDERVREATCTPNSNNCKTCEATIGADTYCSACNGENYAPVNGVCADVGTDKSKCATNNAGAYTQCAGQTFMYKGGCYEATVPPGKTMCTAASAGVCSAAAPGYFVPPEATDAKDSVVWCGDATGVQAGTDGNKQYNGVVNCKTCDGSTLQAGSAGTAKCSSCQEGFFGTNLGKDGATCTACGDDNCTTCAATGKNQCSKCKATNTAGAKLYLKTASSGSTGTCVEASQCGPTTFPKDNAENGNKCVSCGDNTDGVADCAECTTPAQGKTKPACTKCTSGFLHTPEGGETSCPDNCPDGYFGHTSADSGNLQTCQSCSAPKDGLNPAVTGIPGCTQCTYAAARANTLKCTACGSGYKLEGETCVSSSANRSGLSTGAIAGISVAAVVVVGGLVGFLCWWYAPRGATRNVISLHSTVDQ